jgi:uracil-DNA glycosylase
MAEVKIHPSWKNVLAEEFSKDYWLTMTEKLRIQYQKSIVYPPAPQVFRAFELSPLEKLKVVIIGQDPYHGIKQANGLAFSVNKDIAIPPSLQNIYKEISQDLGLVPKKEGDLSRWGKQGVLMLTSVLTVLPGKPGSHAGIGWEMFTDAVIQTINKNKKHIVYLLWGRYAQNKGSIIDRESNLVLTSAHPSPYSASQFFGNHHFSKCNAYLEEHGLKPIDWR